MKVLEINRWHGPELITESVIALVVREHAVECVDEGFAIYHAGKHRLISKRASDDEGVALSEYS